MNNIWRLTKLKKILIIANEIPYPPHKNGICSTLFNYIKCWKKNDIEVELIYLTKEDKINEQHIYNQLNIRCISKDITGKEITRTIFGKKIIKPRNCWHLESNKFDYIDCSKYDYIVLGSLAPSLVIDKLKNITGEIIFFEADSGTMYYERNVKLTHNIIRKLYLVLQVKFISNLEKIMYKNVGRTVFVSSVDCEYTRKRYNGNFIVNPIAVEISNNCIKVVDKTKNKITVDIGFSGIMDYEPNIKAVEYILNNIMPELDMYEINYRIHIIGKNPDNRWKESQYYKNGKLIITGFLDSIEDYIKNMDIYISPLFLGSGMKNKILQAMGIGVPMICSRVSVEGINELIDGVNCYIVDENEKMWCKAICDLANNSYKMYDFSETCKAIIHDNYSWDKSSRVLLGE